MKKLQLAIMAVGLAGAMSANAIFMPPALVTSPGGASFNNTPPPGVEGFAFTTGAATTTWNMLGVYDWGNNGLAVSHVVTLFNAAGGAPIASATIPSGGSATADSFQWVGIAPVILAASTTYVLGASYGNTDPDWFYYGTATLPIGFTLNSSRWADQLGNPSAFPVNVSANGNGYFGPNMAVPEPTTMIAGALLLLPFGASTLRILRRRTA